MLENIDEGSTYDINSTVVKSGKKKSQEIEHKMKENGKVSQKINSKHEHKPFVVPLLVFLLSLKP